MIILTTFDHFRVFGYKHKDLCASIILLIYVFIFLASFIYRYFTGRLIFSSEQVQIYHPFYFTSFKYEDIKGFYKVLKKNRKSISGYHFVDKNDLSLGLIENRYAKGDVLSTFLSNRFTELGVLQNLVISDSAQSFSHEYVLMELYMNPRFFWVILPYLLVPAFILTAYVLPTIQIDQPLELQLPQFFLSFACLGIIWGTGLMLYNVNKKHQKLSLPLDSVLSLLSKEEGIKFVLSMFPYYFPIQKRVGKASFILIGLAILTSLIHVFIRR
jgi:hypothetical protein